MVKKKTKKEQVIVVEEREVINLLNKRYVEGADVAPATVTINGQDISYLVKSIDTSHHEIEIYLYDITRQTVLNEQADNEITVWLKIHNLTVTKEDGNIVVQW